MYNEDYRMMSFLSFCFFFFCDGESVLIQLGDMLINIKKKKKFAYVCKVRAIYIPIKIRTYQWRKENESTSLHPSPLCLCQQIVFFCFFLFFFLFIHRKEKKRKYKEIELQTKPIILKSIWEDIIRMKRNKGQRGGSIIEIMEKKTKQMDYRGGL